MFDPMAELLELVIFRLNQQNHRLIDQERDSQIHKSDDDQHQICIRAAAPYKFGALSSIRSFYHVDPGYMFLFDLPASCLIMPHPSSCATTATKGIQPGGHHH